jgi:hypothetical protein
MNVGAVLLLLLPAAAAAGDRYCEVTMDGNVFSGYSNDQYLELPGTVERDGGFSLAADSTDKCNAACTAEPSCAGFVVSAPDNTTAVCGFVPKLTKKIKQAQSGTLVGTADCTKVTGPARPKVHPWLYVISTATLILTGISTIDGKAASTKGTFDESQSLILSFM